MKILGISGSLRKGSYNTELLNIVKSVLRSDIQFEIKSIDKIPLYNEDLDGDQKPEEVKLFIESIASSDAILFSTPEYNHSISGVLKNAIDWASRPAFHSPLRSMPCGILAASKSPVGGARAQAELKTILSSTLSPVYPSIDYSLPNAHEMINECGEFIDKQARRRLENYVNGYIVWVEKQN